MIHVGVAKRDTVSQVLYRTSILVTAGGK